MGRVLTVINQKGGVGKTTSALQIATILRHRNYKVLVIDMDPQCNISYLSKANMDAYSMLDVMLGNADARSVIQKVKYFDIIISNGNLASYSMRFTGENREYRFKTVIEPILPLYDYIVIDSPPTLSDITVGILTAANDFIVPSTCDILSIEGMKQIYQTYKVVKEYTNPGLTCDGILITRHLKILDNIIAPTVNKVAELLNFGVLNTMIDESVVVRLSLTAKTSLYEFAKDSDVLKQYESVVDELLDKWKGVH